MRLNELQTNKPGKWIVRRTIRYFILFLIQFFLVGGAVVSQPLEIVNPHNGVWQSEESVQIEFKSIHSFGKEFPDQGIAFSSRGKIVGLDTDAEENVYVLDNQLNMLVKFSDTGDLIWKIDQEGRGPGDLENPLGLTVGDKYVFVSNIFGSRLDVFDHNGGFIRSIDLFEISRNPVNIVGVLNESYLVLENIVFGKPGIKISVLDIENKFDLVSQFSAFDVTDLNIPAGAQIAKEATIIDGYVVIAGVMSYRLDYYDVYGSLHKTVKREFPEFVRVGVAHSSNRGYAIQFGGLTGFYQLSDSLLINNVVWPENIKDPDKAAELALKGEFMPLESKNSLDFYSNKGELLYSILSDGFRPEIGSILHSDINGHLYTATNDPYPRVIKYEVLLLQSSQSLSRER